MTRLKGWRPFKAELKPEQSLAKRTDQALGERVRTCGDWAKGSRRARPQVRALASPSKLATPDERTCQHPVTDDDRGAFQRPRRRCHWEGHVSRNYKDPAARPWPSATGQAGRPHLVRRRALRAQDSPRALLRVGSGQERPCQHH